MEIDTVLDAVRPTRAGTVVIVDSFGHLYREQVDTLYKTYAAAMAETGKEIGIHAHNNIQLGFANTIEAIILGANRADATMGGFGRGAGNCPMELLLGFLRNPKFKLRPVVDLLQNHIDPLRETTHLGPLVAVQHHGPVESAPECRDQVPRGGRPQELLAVLRRHRAGLLTARSETGCPFTAWGPWKEENRRLKNKEVRSAKYRA